MIINFYNVGGGGGGGTTNYNQLENKPQINGVTLSGNVSSDQLGITPNELKAVENVPSAATNGSVFSEYREEELGYGWQEPNNTTGNTFHYLNTYDVEQYDAHLADFTYNNEVRDVMLYGGNRRILFGYQHTTYSGDLLQVERGATGSTEAWEGVYVIVNFTNVDLPEISFVDGNGDPVDVVISNEIEPASSKQVIKELKQAYNQTESATTEWAFWGGQTWQGKAENTELRMPTNFIMPSGETLVSNLTYYDIPINTYWDGTQFKVEYSLDSGTTWQWAFSATTFGGSDGPVTVGPSEGQGKTCELSYSWYYYGDADKNCFKLSSNKSLSHPVVNNFTNEYNVVHYDTFMKSGSSYNLLTEKPQINGVELSGNKSKSDLGLNANKLYSGARTNVVLQKEVNGTKALTWANQNDVCFSVDWDGHSDMLLSFNWDDGSETGQTAYFSGGTWFNLDNPDWYRISNGKIYFHRNNYTQLTSIAQGSLSSAVTFYKNVTGYIDGEWFDNIGDCISVYNGPSNSDYWYSFVSGASRNVKMGNVGDGNLTINYGNNIEETIEISNGNWGDTTGWTWEDDHYYKYTPDMGKLMIFHFGDFYWEIRGGNGDLYINNPDVNGIVTGNIEAKEAYNKMFGLYTYNGAVWEKI